MIESIDLAAGERGECGDGLIHREMMSTAAGKIVLQDGCGSGLVERLRADSGLRAFARHADREYELLLGLARRADCQLALAYTEEGVIVGQVTVAPADSWWEGTSNTCEIAVEVSGGWRRLGIARRLLRLVG